MAKLETTRGTVNTDQSGARSARDERRGRGEVVGHQSPNTPKLGAGPKLPEGVRSPSISGDPRRRDGHQASSRGLFGLRLDGHTGSAPAPSVVRPATQDPATATSVAVRLKQLRARRNALEVELNGVPIESEHLEERRQLCNRRHEFCEQIEALETLGDGGPRLTVHLAVICTRYGVRAGDVLRAIVGSALADAVCDSTLMATIVRAARVLATDGREVA